MFPIGRRCGRHDRPHVRPRRRIMALARGAVAWLAVVSCGVAAAQLNLGFEQLDADATPLGWSNAGEDAELASDAATAAEGERSLRLTRTTAAGVTRLSQRIPAAQLRAAGDRVRPARLRFRGLARTAGSAMSAAVWLRIDGPRGPLFLDSAGYARELPEEASGGTSATAAGGTDWRRYEVELPLPADAEEIAFGVSLRGEGSAWFDALELEAVVTDGWPPAAPAAARYVDVALTLMREHSLNRAAIDWPTLRAAALEQARGAVTAADAHLAVRFAVRELGDRHSYLQSAAATRTLATTAVSNARTGSPLSPPQGRRLAERLAYLRVPSFAGGTPQQQVDFAEALKNAIEANDGPQICGWVVDLRQNSGGNLWPMLAGVGPLLGEGQFAASVYPDGRRTPIWYRDGQAGFGDYTQLRLRAPYAATAGVPVAVLLGPATASSAEVLAVAFRSRAATRSFGAPTRGLSAGNRTFPLTDGAALVLTVAATSDTTGQVYTGPIVPDEPVARRGGPSGPDAFADAPLEAAVEWLEAGDVCR
jgi:carboxyl-terminal processing protease